MARDPVQQAGEAQQTYFSLTDQIPEQTWYWAAIGSILVSAMLKLMGKDNWSLFVGQCPPTFLILAIYHKVLRPSQ